MSSAKQTTKQVVKRPQRSDEVAIEEQKFASPRNAVAKPYAQALGVVKHGRHHSDKHNKKRSHHSGSDARMLEGDEQANGEDLEEREDEEDDDEDEDEDDEDDEELKDFIVDDDAVEESGVDEEGQARGDEKKRKKKKKPKVRKLSDEDFELIQENTGQDIKRRKRLQKVSEKEGAELGESRGIRVKHDDDYEEPSASRLERNEKASEEDETEMIDTSTRKRQILPASRRAQVEPENNSSRQVFEDSATLSAKVKQNKGNKVDQQKQDQDLEAHFDADELDDQFATRVDREIQIKDIPERLQLKIGERLQCNCQDQDITEDVIIESNYIFARMVDITQRQELVTNEDEVKKKITLILNLLRKEYLDVPMIAKYRKFNYNKFLKEEDVWLIFNLDSEYGKFRTHFTQMKEFLEKLISAVKEEDNFDGYVLLRYYLQELEKCLSLDALKAFDPLILFLKQFYNQELEKLEANQISESQKKVQPQMRGVYDQISQIRHKGIHQLVRGLYLNPVKFIENLTNNSIEHEPPETLVEVQNKLQTASSEIRETLVASIKKLNAIELSVQPYIRNIMKRFLYYNALLSTKPTEEGQRTLDIYHPSYRVKHIEDQNLSSFQVMLNQTNDESSDIFLDILYCEKKKLITISIELNEKDLDKIIGDYLDKFAPNEYGEEYRTQSLKNLTYMFNDILIPELINEIKNELTEQAENFVIKMCQQSYNSLLMTGPFSRDENRSLEERGSINRKTSKGTQDEDIIPDRPRCSVMSVILQQIDALNTITTVAVVDKFGELVYHQNLHKLLPPRGLGKKQPHIGNMTEEEEQRQKKFMLSLNEEKSEHEKDKDKIKNVIKKYQVDLIVVAANKLESRQIKKTLSDIAENLKSFNTADDDDNKGGSPREAFVIWGNLEVPKLFANSSLSQKLLKGADPILKQAVSLARFEQDPLNEILNLWSFVNQENQALQLNLHPMQKMVNQSKLAESLEDANVKIVNSIGIDLNLVIEHDHMHILLSFLSGIGPRKAKKFIQNLKQMAKPIVTRGEIFMHRLLGPECYKSATGFLKIKIPADDFQAKQNYDILDQTRIHPESYYLAQKVACDVEFENKAVDQYAMFMAIRSVIQRPGKLRELDIERYKQDLENTQQREFIVLIDSIMEEFRLPFKDPRNYRTPTSLGLTPKDLFYMLIDETDKTFKWGMIVTAQVTKVFEGRDPSGQGGFILCKLDNGLDAKVDRGDLDSGDRRIEDLVQIGAVVTGRINKINDSEESKFSVSLNCKRRDLESHNNYIPQNLNVRSEDLINPTFKIDKEGQSQSKYQPRRINHPKFKNINSAKAIQMLQDQEVGEFVFRPSSRGTDNITLSWKFFKNNIVHIDITEHDKAIGASIGAKLQISREDFFENLQEIVERYIIPCNKFMSEASNNVKFLPNCNSIEDLDSILKKEKAQDPNRIPYKLAVFSCYPQHIVLGYIPKNVLVKEYIKVKPKGYFFHETYHKQIQQLINWFKENYRQRDYIKAMKKVKSPRAKAPEPVQQNLNQANKPISGSGIDDQWGGLSKDWVGNRGGNSVHSVNNDDDQQQFGSRPQRNEFAFGGEGRGKGRAGPPGACFSCGESGHMSRECPNKEKRSFGRGRAGGGNRDDDQPRGSKGRGFGSYQQKNQNQESDNKWPSSSPADLPMSNNSPKYEVPNWGNTTNDVPMTNPGPTLSWGSAAIQEQQPLIPSWGNSNDNQLSSNDTWAKPTQSQQNSNNQGWGDDNRASGSNQGWGVNDEDQNRGGGSPINRSPDDSGRGSRGRGGNRGRGGPPQGGGKGCFKCGQEGHFSRECPNPGAGDRGGRGGGGRSCFKCNQEGHMAKDCPNNADDHNDGGGRQSRGRGRGGSGAGAGGNSTCYKCNQQGHFARECPNDQSNNEGGAYKRQRRDDGGSFRRGGGGGGDDNNNWGAASGDNGANPSSSNDAWNSGAADHNQWGNIQQQESQSQPNGNNNDQAQNNQWGTNPNNGW